MAEVWVTAVVVAGTAAYGAYSANQAKNDAQENSDKIFGKKPKVAPFTPIDLAVEQKKATASNLENAPDILAMLDRIQPGFSDTLRRGMETSGELVRGELPSDVQDEIMRSTAFQSLMNGFGGTGMSHSLTARDIGRTSLDMFQLGTNSQQKWSKIAEDAVNPFLITTDDEVNAAAANNAGEQRTQQNINNVNAAPDPGAAGAYNASLAANAATQQSIGQFASLIAQLSRQYNQNQYDYTSQSSGNFGSSTGGTYVYDPTTGSYKRGG